MIPRIIHQTWRNADIPLEWAAYVRSWRALHPGWCYRLWTDDDNRALVAENYGDLLPVYDAYAYRIQRADAARYCILHRYGGVYVDLDIECLRPIDDLIRGRTFAAVAEPDEQAAYLNRSRVVSNALMLSCAGHPVLDAVLGALRANSRPCLTHRDVLATTGPLMLSDVLERYRGDDVSVLDSRVAFPVRAGSAALETLRRKPTGFEALRRLCLDAGAHAVHYWANTWVGSLAGELINPDPEMVAGFEFIRGLDSPGHDIANVGRDIARAAAACRTMPEAIAFNTDGFVKGRLLERRWWTPMGRGAPNEGLYVKRSADATSAGG